MIEILYAIFAYWVFLIYSPSTHFLDNEYPAQLDLRFSKSGERRIPTTADQEGCGCCWAIASATVFSTAVFDARIGKESRLQRYSHQYLVDCIRPLNGCQGIPVRYAFDLIKTDGLPLNSYYEYNSGRTRHPQECGIESKVAIARTKKEGLFYKAEKFGALQGAKAAMDYVTASRLPLVTRIFAPSSFGDYSGEFVYDPSVEECEEAERRQNVTMHVITIVGYGHEAEKRLLAGSEQPRRQLGNRGHRQIY